MQKAQDHLERPRLRRCPPLRQLGAQVWQQAGPALLAAVSRSTVVAQLRASACVGGAGGACACLLGNLAEVSTAGLQVSWLVFHSLLSITKGRMDKLLLTDAMLGLAGGTGVQPAIIAGWYNSCSSCTYFMFCCVPFVWRAADRLRMLSSTFEPCHVVECDADHMNQT